MKKTFLFLLLAATLSLAGCSGKTDNPADTSAQYTPVPTEVTEESDKAPTDVPATPTTKPTAVPKPTATPKPTTTPTPKPTDIPVPVTPLATFDRERTYPDNTTQTKPDITYTTIRHRRAL